VLSGGGGYRRETRTCVQISLPCRPLATPGAHRPDGECRSVRGMRGRAPRIYETTREHEALIVAAVAVFGFLVAFPGLMALAGALPHGLLPVPVTRGATAVAIAESVLGLGLILRNEIARKVFVTLACVGAVYFGVEVVKEHSGSKPSAASTRVSTQGVVAGEQGGPAAAIRAPEEGGTALLGLASLLIPVVFLTRPVVRRVFH